MKSYRRLTVLIVCLFLILFLGVNLLLWLLPGQDEGRPYVVEAFRMADSLSRGEEPDLEQAEYVTEITRVTDGRDYLGDGMHDYVIFPVGEEYYRFDYQRKAESRSFLYVLANGVMAAACLIVFGLLYYFRKHLLKPFHRLESVPYELSKGNLAVALEEEKSRYFGRFVWGVNLLREYLEEQKQEDLNLHKEKKTLLLSLAHDIKTPLSVIRLNAQALKQDLYTEPEKRRQAAQDIVSKAGEIEEYVQAIISTAKDDFLKLDVKIGEFYFDSLIDAYRTYYEGKLASLHTELLIDEHRNLLVRGDRDRLLEVLQNITENAIKYGDGKWIRLRIYREEDCQLVEITNSGAGLKEQEALHVLDSFYRGSNASDKAGSGLGLYICSKLMREMKGDIFVKSSEEGFAVTLVIPMA